ncbi:MAG TPA: ATPase [Armatimonadetes bacterium]|nr:ATPase [Armatimonadota bacterium]
MLDDRPAQPSLNLAAAGYFADRPTLVAVQLARALGRPLLVEGPPGVGKTELARATAEVTGRRLIRLQCYEGLDEARALYEWDYGKQLLTSTLLRDQVGALLIGAGSLAEAAERLAREDSAFFSRHFLLPRPLLTALTSHQPTVLLIDEIDRADEAFEAFLLELLADYQVTIPELGTVTAVHRPLVFLTSNGTRPLADALRRRCLYLYLDYPDLARELTIVRAKVPDLDEELAAQAVRFVHRLRGRGLRRPPSLAETLDWALALLTLQADRLDEATLDATLGVLVKEREDLRRAGGLS